MSLRILLLPAMLAAVMQAQVSSPWVLRKGQVDARTPASLAAGICQQAGAHTPREKAEAIWRFFLTDGRFVKPGFWYHIAGWAYEEPAGEVLDPVKLANSYGFGLCYQVAPLLAAVWEGAGLPARVWFLTGHTVAEVFYDGAYHHYDSDMMGYSTAGAGPPRQSVVASVRQIERDPGIILSKLLAPARVNPALVDSPWYPADVRAAAIDGLADLFRTTEDNRLFLSQRHPEGHTMDFELRPGERMTRYFQPEEEHLYYLPYARLAASWREFPREIAEYNVRTADGPGSQKDARRWATGKLEYEPELTFDAQGRAVVDVTSPYVIIDAAFLTGASGALDIETSTDGGVSWLPAGDGPKVLASTEHGRLTAVSGTYGYRLRVTRRGPAPVRGFRITTRFELNPRTLPQLETGRNEMLYRPGPALRRTELPVGMERLSASGRARVFAENGQAFLVPPESGPAEVTAEVAAPDGSELRGFDAGGRFLDLRDGLAPDKLTAETRVTEARPAGQPAASMEWSASREGPYRPLWTYKPDPQWLDGERITRLLRWPEADARVRDLPPGTQKVYVRYRFSGLALDSVRLAAISPSAKTSSLEITHVWREGGRERSFRQVIAQPAQDSGYAVEAGPDVSNQAVIFYCPKPPRTP